MGEKFKERDKGNQRKKRWFPAIDIFEVTDLPTAEELARRQQLHDEQSVSVDTETDKVPQEVVYTSSMSAEKPEAVVGVPNWSGDVSVEDSSSTAVAPEVALQEHIKRNAELRQAEFERKAQNAVLNHQESRSLEEQELINEREQRRIAIRNKISEEKTNRYNRTVESVIPEKASGTVEAQPLVEDEPNKVKIRFDRSLAQMDRLITSTKKLRQETGLSHRDALVSVENFSEVRSKIREIRSRIKKSQETGQGDIQTLRDELAEHLRAFKKLKIVEKNAPSAVPDVQTPEKTPEVTKTQEKIYEGGDRYRDSVEKYLDSSERSVRSNLSFVPQEWMFFYGQKMTELGSKANEIKKTLADFYENESGGMYGVDHFTDEEKRHIGTLVADFNTILEDLVEIQTGDEKDKQQENLTVEEKFEVSLQKELDKEFSPEAMAASEEEALSNSLVDDLGKALGNKEEGKGETIPEKKEYEGRLEVRNVWKGKKSAYEKVYEEYLKEQQQINNNKSFASKLAFWKKEVQPESVRQAEQEYRAARKEYADSLNAALELRSGSKWVKSLPEEKKFNVKAGLANRFVLKAAHDRLAIEKEFVPEGRGAVVFEKMQEVFKKHGKTIKILGYVTTAGIGVTTGGVAYALSMLAGKTVGAKLTALGSVGGAFATNALYDAAILNPRELKRDTAREKAQWSFSGARLDALENEYLEKYRSYESGVRKKKYAVVAGAVTGAALGAALSGNIDIENSAPYFPNDPRLDIPVPPNGSELLSFPNDPRLEIPVASNGSELPYLPTDPRLEIPVFSNEVRLPDTAPIPEGAPEEIRGGAPLEEDPFVYEPPVNNEFEDKIDPETVTPPEDWESIEDVEHAEMEEEAESVKVPEMLFTFEEGEKIDTVSEALYESWKVYPDLLEEDLSKKEFLAEMYTAIAEIEKDPVLNAELMEKMGIASGDIDEVKLGETVNLQPFFEYLNKK